MVYAGINTLVALRHLPQKSTETANFLKQVNSIFDFLNVRRSRYNKKPLKGDEADQIQIANLRRQAQTWKVQHNRSRPRNFLALDQNLHAVELLSRDLVQKGVFPHLLTGRFNQDCLENFFSQIRAKGGHRFSPSTKEFTHAYRALATNILLANIPSANCIQDSDPLLTTMDDFRIQTQTRKRKRHQEDTDTTDDISPAKKQRVCAGVANADPQDCTGFLDDSITELDLAVTNVVAYIGGYIIRKLKLPEKCSNCLTMLVENSCTSVVSEQNLYLYISKFTPTMTVLLLVHCMHLPLLWCNFWNVWNLYSRRTSLLLLQSYCLYRSIITTAACNKSKCIFENLQSL